MENGATTNGHEGSFWGDGIVLILDCDDDCTTLWNYWKTIELYTENEWLLWYLN